MRANALVYDFLAEAVVPILSISVPLQLKQSANYYLSTGMLQAGSLTDEGLRVTDYAAFYNFALGRFIYSEVTFG